MTGLPEIEARIRACGLSPRGALRLEAGELPGVASVVLIGMVGDRNWSSFAGSPEYCDGGPDPLDRFSRRVIGALAEELGARALFPFAGPPFLPFQRWAQRAEPLFPSPLGLLIHPDYGLWHSFRGALGFAEQIALGPKRAPQNPCEACATRPCLQACPVGAFGRHGYDVEACAGHLRTPAGDTCLTGGCLARRDCPVGREYAQNGEAASFHMAAFLASRAR